MRNFNQVLAVGLFAVTSAFGADSALLNLIAPEAKVIGGIYVDRTSNSPFGQYLISQMKEEDQGFRRFVDATGFDPRRDLREVVMASVDGSGKNSGIVLARGLFDGSRILSHARAVGGGTTTYLGVDILTSKGDGGWVAFLDNSTAVAGQPEMVKTAIMRRRGGAPLEAKMAAKVNEVSNRYDAWLVSLVPVSQLAARGPKLPGQPNPEAFRAIEETSGGVTFGVNIDIAAEAVTRSDKDASALADVLRFLAGIMQMNQDKPNMQVFSKLLESLNLTTQANTMKLTMSIPATEVEKLIKPNHNHGRVRKVAQRR